VSGKKKKHALEGKWTVEIAEEVSFDPRDIEAAAEELMPLLIKNLTLALARNSTYGALPITRLSSSIYYTSFIPHGGYCYSPTGVDMKKGILHTKLCPYWKRGGCTYLGVEAGEDVLLLEQVKICGVNEDEDT
jgi:hypothetical protein